MLILTLNREKGMKVLNKVCFVDFVQTSLVLSPLQAPSQIAAENTTVKLYPISWTRFCHLYFSPSREIKLLNSSLSTETFNGEFVFLKFFLLLKRLFLQFYKFTIKTVSDKRYFDKNKWIIFIKCCKMLNWSESTWGIF